MKRLLFILICLLTFNATEAQDAYKIQVKLKDLKDTSIFMSYYYGKGQYYKDTALVNAKGEAVFTGKDTLAHGMYSVLVDQSKIFDFIIDQQKLSFETSIKEPIDDMKTKGGSENQIFFEYLQFLNKRQAEANVQRGLKKKATKGSQEYEAANKRIEELDQEVRTFLEGFYKRNKGSFTVNFLKSLEAPEIPDFPPLATGERDSIAEFIYYRDHFFDKLNFDDGRLLRTSAYHDKITFYIDKLKAQDPDTIIRAADLILGKAAASPELFQYTLNHFTQKYERSELMGMDAVFVHLVKNYFMKGKTDWLTEKQMKKLVERATALDPLLIGKKAPNIIVRDTAQKEFIQLYNIKSKYTVVYIWSPDCGHCKVATPKLKKLYDRWKDRGVEVFGVGNEFENEEWIKFINKYDLNWINGSDGGDFTSNFRSIYDVHSTPQTYLLDEEKVIVSKKMDIESLEKILEYLYDKEAKDEKP